MHNGQGRQTTRAGADAAAAGCQGTSGLAHVYYTCITTSTRLASPRLAAPDKHMRN